MTGVHGVSRVRAVATSAVVLLGCLTLAGVLPPQVSAPALVLAALVFALRRPLTSRQGLLVVLVLTVFWIPDGRYSVAGLPGGLPWRLAIMGLLLFLFLSLALDRRVRWRRMPMIGLVLGYPVAVLVSVLANVLGLAEAGQVGDAALAVGQLFLIAGMAIVVRQFCWTSWDVDRVCRMLILAGGVVAVAAAWETLTGYNVFTDLHRFLPLQVLSDSAEFTRSGAARAVASAKHPIALSAVLAMLLPVAVFLSAHSPWPRTPGTRKLLFGAVSCVLVLGAFLTGSRTFIVMLFASGLLLLVLHWTLFVRVLMAAVPLTVAAAVVMPSKVLTLFDSLLHPSALVESQYTSPGWRGSGRLADLGPSLEEAGRNLFFGTGAGSRIVNGPGTNARILDNQYLTTLLESGIVGLLAMAALLFGPAFLMVRRFRDPRLAGPERDLALALACVFTSYAVGSFFFDSFSFLQTLMLFLILLGVASWLVARADARPVAHEPAATEALVG
jgi:hypothetical protein